MKYSSSPSIWQKSFFVILLYSTIFSPPLAIGGVHFYFGWLLWPISLWYLLNNRKEFSRFRKCFSTEILLIILIMAYSLFRGLLGGDLNLAINDLMGAMSLILIPFFYLGYGKKIGIDSVDDLTKYILIAVTLGVSSTILALLIPSVDDFIRNVFIQYREGELGNELKFRGFGLGSNMTSFYSFCIGMAVVFSFIYGKREKWFKWIILFALIACLVNARTGAIVAIIGIFIYFLFSKNYIGLIVASIVGVILYIYIYDILGFFLGEESMEWIGVFLDQMEAMVSGDTSEGGLDYFTQDMAISPHSIMGWIFGYGISPFGGATIEGKYYFSDMGFVIQLFYGGLIFCVLLYSLVLKICFRLWKIKQKSFSVFLLATFLIINFKGRFLFATPGFALALLLFYAVASLGSKQQPYRPNIQIFK